MRAAIVLADAASMLITSLWAMDQGGAVKCEGGGPGDVGASPQAIFAPKAGAADKAIGTYIFRYRAIKPGQCKLRVVYVSPGGPGASVRRRATALIKEFIVTVRVTAPPQKSGSL